MTEILKMLYVSVVSPLFLPALWMNQNHVGSHQGATTSIEIIWNDIGIIRVSIDDCLFSTKHKLSGLWTGTKTVITMDHM